jgi:hypothetical protein
MFCLVRVLHLSIRLDWGAKKMYRIVKVEGRQEVSVIRFPFYDVRSSNMLCLVRLLHLSGWSICLD